MKKNLFNKELAELAIQNKLFVEDWQMKKYYEDIKNGDENLGIHLIFDNNYPVASCVINLEEGSLNVFVNKAYRGKKYGQQVVFETMEKYNRTVNDVYGVEGIEGSKQFYNSCGIAYFKTGYFNMSLEELQLVMINQLDINTIRKKRIKESLIQLNNQNKTRKLKK